MADRKCTFVSTGANFVEQRWFECYTCGLSGGSGICEGCAQHEHNSCSLSEAKFSRFYCDCGAGGSCKLLNPPAPRKPTKSKRRASPISLSTSTAAVGISAVSLTTPRPYRPNDLPSAGGDGSVVRVPPFYYVHIHDSNTTQTHMVEGPAAITLLDHQSIVLGPREHLKIPPGHYAMIRDPVLRDADKNPVVDQFGGFKLDHGNFAILLQGAPVPVLPGEQVEVGPTPLQVVADQTALRLRAERDVDEGPAGFEWLFPGPATYVPRVAVRVVEVVTATVIGDDQALRLKARNTCVDVDGTRRQAGEEWLVDRVGAYLPAVDEVVVGLVDAFVLTETIALHLRATKTFDDPLLDGVVRQAGSEWLVTLQEADTYIVGVYEEVVGVEDIIVLTNSQYCVICDPLDANGVPQFGKRVLKRGPASFFLQAGESLESGIQSVFVLSAQEALLCVAKEGFTDRTGETPTRRAPGDRWLVFGPTDYTPPVEVDIIDRRKEIPLDQNEGIYVRDVQQGGIRAVVGESYMLQEYEELWEKDLPPQVEELLSDGGAPRDRTRVVSYRVPHNAAIQIYDYKAKQSRVIFGPELVLLAPDEQFTQLNLSGGKPKRNAQIRDLKLMLGPDYMTDILTVETADHARLSLKLSYSWRFDVDPTDEDARVGLFSVPDFVGDACKAVASRVRGAVASIPFDQFHKGSASIINSAVFGVDAEGMPGSELRFRSNGLVIDNVDIQSVEPVDQRTRDALQKSVQMAIEITTNSQEAAATHEAQRLAQEARGRLDRQKIEDQALAERSRSNLLALKAKTAAIESTGQATAEAKARAEAAEIEGAAAVTMAQLRADASTIESAAELERITSHQAAELEHQRALDDLEIEKAKKLAEIETTKFANVVESIGPQTLKKIAQAGPEMQARLLEGLGLEGYLVTDGQSPINLFGTANGMVGGLPAEYTQ